MTKLMKPETENFVHLPPQPILKIDGKDIPLKEGDPGEFLATVGDATIKMGRGSILEVEELSGPGNLSIKFQSEVQVRKLYVDGNNHVTGQSSIQADDVLMISSYVSGSNLFGYFLRLNSSTINASELLSSPDAYNSDIEPNLDNHVMLTNVNIIDSVIWAKRINISGGRLINFNLPEMSNIEMTNFYGTNFELNIDEIGKDKTLLLSHRADYGYLNSITGKIPFIKLNNCDMLVLDKVFLASEVLSNNWEAERAVAKKVAELVIANKEEKMELPEILTKNVSIVAAQIKSRIELYTILSEV